MWTPEQIKSLQQDCAKLGSRLFQQIGRFNRGAMGDAFMLVGSQGAVIPSPRRTFTEVPDADIALSDRVADPAEVAAP